MQNNVTEKSMKTKLSKQSLEQEIFFLKFVIPVAEIFRQLYTNKSQNEQLPNELTFSSHFLLDLASYSTILSSCSCLRENHRCSRLLLGL